MTSNTCLMCHVMSPVVGKMLRYPIILCTINSINSINVLMY